MKLAIALRTCVYGCFHHLRDELLAYPSSPEAPL